MLLLCCPSSLTSFDHKLSRFPNYAYSRDHKLRHLNGPPPIPQPNDPHPPPSTRAVAMRAHAAHTSPRCGSARRRSLRPLHQRDYELRCRAAPRHARRAPTRRAAPHPSPPHSAAAAPAAPAKIQSIISRSSSSDSAAAEGAYGVVSHRRRRHRRRRHHRCGDIGRCAGGGGSACCHGARAPGGPFRRTWAWRLSVAGISHGIGVGEEAAAL
jgi:hypothetical protein